MVRVFWLQQFKKGGERFSFTKMVSTFSINSQRPKQRKEDIMKRIIFVVLIAAVLLIWSGVASAGGEILGCQGGYNNNTTRQSERIASFSLSNFNDSAVIILQRIAIYDRLGDVLCDTDQGPIGNMSEGDEIAPNGSQWFNVGPTNCPGVAPTGETNYSGKIYWFTPGKYKNPLHGRTTYRTWNTGINPNRIEA